MDMAVVECLFQSFVVQPWSPDCECRWSDAYSIGFSKVSELKQLSELWAGGHQEILHRDWKLCGTLASSA